MFRLIKIVFNAFLLVLAIIGFNAIGGQKYVEILKRNVTNFVQERAMESAKKVGNFTNLHEEFQIDNTLNLMGYKAVLAEHKISVQRDLCYLTGSDMEDYLHDVAIMQQFANDNRYAMLNAICKGMGGKIVQHISSIHNYIDVENRILRKGAISAQKDEILVIPLNMRDGLLVCKGKGNPEWNYSAPHGAGRLYSRSNAKKLFTVEEYEMEMEGIYSTCINEGTLDEAPFAYKDYREIMECIEPTVDILDRLIPIFNFKASD